MPSEQYSVITSLAELRAIEHQRIADELAARAREAAAQEATRHAEAARAAAIARAERDAILAEAARIEAAAAAERRAAELAIACAEATARARAQVELDAERLAQEMSVRREQVARTRPTGLVAVIAALVLGGVALGVVLFQQRDDLAAREAAIHDVQARADKLHRESDDLARTAHDLQAEVEKRNADLAAQKAHLAQLTAATTQPHAQPPAANHPHAAQPPVVPAVRPPIVLDARCTDTVLGCMK